MESDAIQAGASALPDMGPLMLKSFLMLGVVLVILVVVAWCLKRFTGLRAISGQGPFKVHGTCHLGPKERLMLVDADGVRLLLGVTPQGISTLHTYGETSQGDEEEPPETKSIFETLFRRQLKKGETD